MWREYDDKLAHDICYNSGSDVTKRTHAYFRRQIYQTPDKVWAEMLDDYAFYFAVKYSKHVRLIEIAVKTEYQGKGIGMVVLYRLLERMKRNGIKKMTFRTPRNEKSHTFWLHLGAKIKDVKGDDYEMELNIE